MDILGLIRRLPEIVSYNKFDDDLFDRLNYSHTVAVLIVFAIIVTNRQFSESQIKCWVPAQFTGSYEQYVNQICFITNTYSFDLHETLPDDEHQRHEHELKYYQWTPFILLLMAILFYIPHKFWRGLSLRSGVDLKDLIEAAQTYRSANVRHEDKVKLLNYLANWLHSYCSNSYRLTTLHVKKSPITRKARCSCILHHLCFPFGIYTGNYLMISYLFIKFLYLLNSIGQVFLLNTLLGRHFLSYGIELIHRYWTKQISFLDTGDDYFPKVVFCDFVIREPNHPKESHRYTVQCVLPFNLFNQQIFTYLYFWLIIMSCFNFISILIWIYRLFPWENFRYLERRLGASILDSDEKNHHEENDRKKKFVYRYLQGDGTFMLRLVTGNVSDYVCKKILIELYKVFCYSITTETMGREPLFQPILTEQELNENDENQNNDQEDENENVDEDGSTDQTIAGELPPIPNPRHGRILVERDSFIKLPSDIRDTEQKETIQTDSNPRTNSTPIGQFRNRSSLTPLLKDIHRISEVHTDSSESTSQHYKNVDFQTEPDTILSSVLPSPSVPPTHLPPTPPPPPPALKGPSPYATTYLTSRRRSDHELPYIDDSISSSSNSGRLTNMAVVRQSEKPTTTLASTNIFFRRSHDV